VAKTIFYPSGNADTCLLHLDNDLIFFFDYADMRNPEDPDDKRVALEKSFKDDLGWPKRNYVDVGAFTHGDTDHIKRVSEVFWLEHATKYQNDDRIKINELWVPAALVVEEGCEDETRIIRAEARYRFLNKKGIKVFSRPEHLKDWLEGQGKKLEDYMDLIVDAGRTVPSYSLDTQGIEFFVHSPFAKRTEDGLLDRNDNCLVMQATIRVNGIDTRFLITADCTSHSWDDIVDITRLRQNDHRLAWDIFKIPHHCSYLSMGVEKGEYKTQPSGNFEWLLQQGAKRSVMVSSSWPIPTTTEDQPPHVETYRRYKDTAQQLDAEIVVTMENPSKNSPKRTVITIDANGATLKRDFLSAAFAVTSTKSPRVG
jgi:hypothetical protein